MFVNLFKIVYNLNTNKNSMTSQKRSKKSNVIVAFFILLSGMAIGGYLVLKSDRGAASELSDILKGKSFTAGSCQPDPNNPNLDSDNDGLKDWEETQVYNSDPCQADTDGDGYTDGEEIASGYDPTKKAPGDELPGTMPKTPRPLPENLTEALRQKLAQQLNQDKIAPLTAQGELLSGRELQNYPGIQQTVQEMVSSYPGLFAPDKIDDSQIKTTADNSRQAIQRYAAAAETIFQSSSVKSDSPQSGSETEMFSKAVENGDFTELNRRLQEYQTIHQKLPTLTVPSDLVAIHKEQLNIFSALIKIYQAIEQINTDPLKANLALQHYANIRQQFSNWLEKLAKFIEAHP